MKKFKTLGIILIGLLATVVMGACSCKKSNVHVLRLVVNVVETEGVEIDPSDSHTIRVVEGTTFDLQYEIKPDEATNTKVTFATSDSSVIQLQSAVSVIGQTGRGTFVALELGNYNTATLSVTTDDGGFREEVKVTVLPEPEALNEPSNLHYDTVNNRVEWDAVDNAAGYIVNINNEEYVTATNYYTGTLANQLEFEPGQEYRITVRTKGNGVTSKDSVDSSNPIILNILNTPSITSVNNGLIEWANVTNATNYVVYIDEQEALSGTATSIDLKNYYDRLNKSTYTFNVNIMATSNKGSASVYYVNSAQTTTKQITWLQAPTGLKFSNYSASVAQNKDSVASWNTVPGATGYDITVGAYDVNDSKETFYTIPTGLTAGNHTLTVTARGDASNTISDESSTALLSFGKLPQLATKITGNILTVDYTQLNNMFHITEEGAKQFVYEMYFSVAGILKKVIRIDSDDNLTYDLSGAELPEGGTYTVYVKPLAISNTPYVNGIYTTTGTDNDSSKTSFTKLQYATVSKISKTGVITINTIDHMTEYGTGIYDIYVNDKLISVPVDQDNDNLTIGTDTTTIDLNFDSIKMADLEAKSHTVRVIPRNANFVDATSSLCTTFTFTKLGVSKDYRLNNSTNTVTWTGDANNSKYQVTFNGVASTVPSASYVADSSQLADTNTFSVVALGNDYNYINSDSYNFSINRLNTLNTIRIDNGQLKWDNTECNYHISIYMDSSSVPYQTLTTGTNSYELSAAGNYNITIYQSKEGYFNSPLTDRIAIQQLSKPTNIALVKGSGTDPHKITFNAVANASEYSVVITNTAGTDTVYTLNGSTTELQLPTTLVGDVYTVKVMAIGDKANDLSTNGENYAYVNSKFSSDYSFTKLTTPVASLKNGKLTWKISSNVIPGTYQMVFSGGAIPTQTVTAASVNGEYDFSEYLNGTSRVEYPAGVYTFTLQALAKEGTSGANVIDSDVSAGVTVTKLGKVEAKVDSGVISFANNNATQYEVQYSIDNQDSSWKFDSRVTTSTLGDSTTVLLNGVTNGYLRFRSVAGDGYISGSYSDSIKFEQLPTVTQFSKTAKTLSWASVANSTGYYVQSVDTADYKRDCTAAELSVTIDDPTTVGAHYFSILAKGSTYTIEQTKSNTIYLSSNPVELEVDVLQSVTGLTLNNGVLSWTKYSGVTAHDVPVLLMVTVEDNDGNVVSYRINNMNQTTFDLKEACAENGDPLSEDKTYTVYFQYQGDDNTLLDGAKVAYQSASGSQNIKKFTAPVLTVAQGKIVYTITDAQFTTATNYEVQICEEGATGYVTLTSGTDYTITNNGTTNTLTIKTLRQDVNYSVRMKTLAHNAGLNSEYGADLTVCKYGAIVDFHIEAGQFKWTPNGMGQTYLIQEKDDNSIAVITESNNGSASADLVDEEGTYYFQIKALGTQTYSGSGVAYLDSEFSTTARVTYVGQVENIKLDNNVLSWDEITGVYSYAVELISDGEVKFSQTIGEPHISLSTFENVLIQGAYNTFSVRAIKTLDDSYIISTFEGNDTLSIYAAPSVQNLRVLKGEIAWDVDVNAFLSYYTIQQQKTNPDFVMNVVEIQKIKQLIENCVKGVETGSEDDLEIYKSFYCFTLDINGTEINLVPGTKDIVSDQDIQIVDGALKATFYYGIKDDVHSYTAYNVKVKSMGNTVGEDDTFDMALGSKYSSNISALKAPSPETTILKDGTITFALLTDTNPDGSGGVAHSYVTDYIITATPTIGGEQGVQKTQEIHLDPATLTNYQYTYDLTPNDDSFLSKNVAYNIIITSLGTIDSTTLAEGETYFLRSSNYTSQTVMFLDKVQGITYSDDNDEAGGYYIWNPRVVADQQLFFVKKDFYEANALDGAGDPVDLEDWLIEENYASDQIIAVNVESGVRSFTFHNEYTDPITGQKVVIPAGDYYFGIRLKGDGQRLIESKTIDFQLVTKLPPATRKGASWLLNGQFTWNEINDCQDYSIVVIESNPVNGGEPIRHPRTVVHDTYYTIPDEIGGADSSFALEITPLGKGGLLSGYMTTTLSYRLLNTPNASFTHSDTLSRMVWDPIPNAARYEVMVGDTPIIVSETEYVFESFPAGEYSVKVRALSENDNFLHGKFSELTTIVKLANPVLRAEKVTEVVDDTTAYVRPGSVVVWKNEDETLNSGNVKLQIFNSDETGAKYAQVGADLKLENNVRYYDLSTTNYPVGYYLVAVTFVDDPTVTSEYTLPSDTISMLVYKPACPAVTNGTYYRDDQIDLRPTTFTGNYLQWDLVTNGDYVEYNYTVKIYQVNLLGEEILVNSYDTITNPQMFELDTAKNTALTDPTKMFMDISGIVYDDVNIYVACMGEVASDTTLVDPDSVRFVSSSYCPAHNVKIPVNKPVVISTAEELSKGIIKWENEYNCDVEIVLNYKYGSYGTAATENLTHNEILQFANGVAPTEYHLPFVSNDYAIQLRYVRADKVSPFSDTLTTAVMTLFAYGSGTETDPYIIYSNNAEQQVFRNELYSQLRSMTYYPNAYYKLMSTFTLPEDWSKLDIEFNGHFDGNGNVIKGINVLKDSNKNAMFTTIGENGVFTNVTLEFATEVTGSQANVSNAQFAALVVTNNGTIDGVEITGSYNINYAGLNIEYGAYAITNNGTITNSTMDMDIVILSSTMANVGGVVHTNNGTISDSELIGSVKATISTSEGSPTYMGGIAYSNMGDIVDTEVSGTLYGNGIGGIAYTNAANITACRFIGNLTVDEQSMFTIRMGGIAAQNIENGSIVATYAILTESTFNMILRPSTTSIYGGLVGYMDANCSADAHISNSYVSLAYTRNESSISPQVGNIVGNMPSVSLVTFSNVYYINTGNGAGDSFTVVDIDGVDVVNNPSSLPENLNTNLEGYQFRANVQFVYIHSGLSEEEITELETLRQQTGIMAYIPYLLYKLN